MADTDRIVTITKVGDSDSPWFTTVGGLSGSHSITLHSAMVEWNINKGMLAIEKTVSSNNQSTKANVSMIWDLKKITTTITITGKLANISGGNNVRTQRNILMRMLYDGGPCFLDLGESVDGSNYNEFTTVHTADTDFEIQDLNSIKGFIEKLQIKDTESVDATELIGLNPDVGVFNVILQFRVGTKK